MYIGLHIEYLLSLSNFKGTWIFCTEFEKSSDINRHEYPPNGSRVVPCGRTDRHDETDILFSKFSERPLETKNNQRFSSAASVCICIYIRITSTNSHFILHDNIQRGSHKHYSPPTSVTWVQLLRMQNNTDTSTFLTAETRWFKRTIFRAFSKHVRPA